MLPESAEDFRTIWLNPDDHSVVQVIDQRKLPHDYSIHELRSWTDGVVAITEMTVRGAPLIGATAAWSLYLASLHRIDPEAEIPHRRRCPVGIPPHGSQFALGC